MASSPPSPSSLATGKVSRSRSEGDGAGAALSTSPSITLSAVGTHTVPEHTTTATAVGTPTTTSEPAAPLPSSCSPSPSPSASSAATTSTTTTTATPRPMHRVTPTSSPLPSSSASPTQPPATQQTTANNIQEARQQVRPWYRPPPRGYRAPTRYVISVMTTANILASGYSNARLSELVGAAASSPPISSTGGDSGSGSGGGHLSMNSNNTSQTTTAAAATPSANATSSTTDPRTQEAWLAYVYRATTYIIRIPFREMIGGGDRPYDPTIEAAYADIPLRAYQHIPSTTTLPSPPADLGWLKRRWWPVQEYFRQLRRGTRGKSRSVMMAIKLSWILAFLYTLVLTVALILDRNENCTLLKVFLGIFVAHKIIVSLYMTDRALYRLPLDLVEHDPDIDDEQANGLAVYLSPLFTWHSVLLFAFVLCYIYPIGYPQWSRQAPASAISAVVFAVTGFLPFYLILFVGVVTFGVLVCFYLIFLCIYWPAERYGLIRRRVISRRNGGYQSDGIVNTLDLDALERTLENAVGAGFGDGKQIAVTAAIAAIPEVIYHKPKRTTVPAFGGAGAMTSTEQEMKEKTTTPAARDSTLMPLHMSPQLPSSPWERCPEVAGSTGAAAAAAVVPAATALVDEALGSSSSIAPPTDDFVKSPTKKLNSAEKRDQVMIQMEIDEEVLSVPGSETHGSSSMNSSSIAIESLPSTQQPLKSHERSASGGSIPLSIPCTPSPEIMDAEDSSSTPCAPPFVAMFASISPSPSMSSSLSNVSVGPKPASHKNSSSRNSMVVVDMESSSAGMASTVTTTTATPAVALEMSTRRCGSSNSHRSQGSHGSSHRSCRRSVAGSGVWEQLATAGEIAAAAESLEEKEKEVEQGQTSLPQPTTPKQSHYRQGEEGIESCHELPTECAVCLFDYEEGETLRHLRCDHYFHRDCVDRWLIKHPLCPTCRSPI
ncbi:hypothetical protein BGZ73_008231 [Actinomortierella ambigua]|nr:hypothetical protein BGZ73_008231 [Actinomortierella ambigua]